MKLWGSRQEFILFLVITVSLTSILPVIVFQHPFGTDTYYHAYMTSLVMKSGGLHGFYDDFNSKYPGSSSDEYPFGMWVFGAILGEVCGLDVISVSIILPVLIIIGIILCFIIFSSTFLKKRSELLLATILFLTIPLVSSSILNYHTKLFVLPAFFIILYIFFNKNLSNISRLSILSITGSFLILSHGSTTIFFLFSMWIYLVFETIWGGDAKERKNHFKMVGMFVCLFAILGWVFPTVYTQHMTVLGKLKRETIVNLIPQGIRGFYENIIVSLEKCPIYFILLYIILYSGLLVLSLLIRKRKLNNYIKLQDFGIPRIIMIMPAALYLIGIFHTIAINGVSKELISSSTVIGSVFWLGTINVMILPLGLSDSNYKLLGLLIIFSLIIIPIAIGSPKGSSRMIWFYTPLIAIIASLGIHRIVELWRGWITDVILVCILSMTLISPVVGNIYFQPDIAEKKSELTAISTLGRITPGSIFLAPNYRQRLELYGDIKNIDLKKPQDSTERSLLNTYSKELYSSLNDNAIIWLEQYGIEYTIYSDRTLKTIAVEERPRKVDIGDLVYNNKEILVYRLSH